MARSREDVTVGDTIGPVVVTVTREGYIKRTRSDNYRSQHRGGKGRSGMSMKDEDAVTSVFSASTHTPVLFFSSLGRVYKLKVYKLPLGFAVEVDAIVEIR